MRCQWAKALAARPEVLNSIPRICMVKENQLLRVVLCPPHVLWYALNKFNFKVNGRGKQEDNAIGGSRRRRQSTVTLKQSHKATELGGLYISN